MDGGDGLPMNTSRNGTSCGTASHAGAPMGRSYALLHRSPERETRPPLTPASVLSWTQSTPSSRSTSRAETALWRVAGLAFGGAIALALAFAAHPAGAQAVSARATLADRITWDDNPLMVPDPLGYVWQNTASA